jgi:hypothetical protein
MTAELALQAQEPFVVAGLDQFVHEAAAVRVASPRYPPFCC